MNTTETLYLLIEPSKKWWRRARIAKVTKKKPTLADGQALIRLQVEFPDNICQPPEVTVKVKQEHIAPHVSVYPKGEE